MARVDAAKCHAIDVSDGRVRPAGHGDAGPGGAASIDELLDRAVAAINRGDRVAATALAEQVLAVDGGNADAEDLLAAPADAGEIRRLTIFSPIWWIRRCCRLGWSPKRIGCWWAATATRCCATVNRFEGHVGSTKGDGLLAVFGHPHRP